MLEGVILRSHFGKFLIYSVHFVNIMQQRSQSIEIMSVVVFLNHLVFTTGVHTFIEIVRDMPLTAKPAWMAQNSDSEPKSKKANNGK